VTIDFNPSASSFDPSQPDTFPDTGREPASIFDRFYTAAEDHRGHRQQFRWGQQPGEAINVRPVDFTLIQKTRDAIPVYDSNASCVRDWTVLGANIRLRQMKQPSAAFAAKVELYTAMAEIEDDTVSRAKHEAWIAAIDLNLRQARPGDDRLQAIARAERAAMAMEYPDARQRVAKLLDDYRR
jgi:hypothetical protein